MSAFAAGQPREPYPPASSQQQAAPEAATSAATPAAEQPAAVHAPAGALPAPPSTAVPAQSPRRSTDFGGPGHTRHIRLAAILRSCSEQPDLLFDLLGIDMMADALALPPAAVQRMMEARASVRRRFARRVRERMGLSLDHLHAALTLPDDPQELLRAAHLFGVAIRLAGTRRVMSRIAFQALNDRWGADAVTFGFAQQPILDPHAEVLTEYKHDDVPNLTDLRLFVRSLAAHGHGGAAIVALKLGLPVTLATARVANLDLALETGLPTIAAAALAALGEAPPPDHATNAARNDEAAWEVDASDDQDPPSNPDSTEAA
jgi:hypothetical protein